MNVVHQTFLKKRSFSVKAILSFLSFLGFALVSFTPEPQTSQQLTTTVKLQFMQDLSLARQKAAYLAESIQLLKHKQTTLPAVQAAYIALKKAYKRTEFLTEFLDADLAKKLNGAPIPKVVISDADYLALDVKEPLFITLPPEGLQVLEELMFVTDGPDTDEAYRLALKLEEGLVYLASTLQHQPLTETQLLESSREEIIRVITMGITGFDAPAAGNEMVFAAAALEPVLAITHLYAQGPTAGSKEAEKAKQLLQKAILYLQQHPDFDTFDRLTFIREFADPAYGAVTRLQQVTLGKPGPEKILTKPVNNLALSLFDKDFLLTAYYAKQDRTEPVKAQIELGKMLFFDPVLSSNNQRSCASCHNPTKAFTDGAAKSLAFEANQTVSRNSPTLLNSIFATAYFWDSRAGYLEDQIPEVVQKADELHSSYDEVVQKLEQSPAYQKLFKQAFKAYSAAPVNATTVNRAIAAYLRTLVSLDSPFDKYMRKEADVLSASAKRGANLFMGKAGCATCHFAPVFNGTVPPRFLESETEVIGVPVSADFTAAVLDPDKGRASVIRAEAFEHAFKTPTVRNAALTAPYMHNGAFTTLAEVVAFYNLGGGAGLGLNLPNQTLPAARLNLTEQEIKDIVAFMESLSDNTAAGQAPKALPVFPDHTALKNRPVGGHY